MYVEYIIYIPKNKYIVLVLVLVLFFILYSFYNIKLCISRLSKIYLHNCF